MKTAEEWTTHIREAGNHLSSEHLFEVEIPAVVKQIQLDAIREGMLRAADKLTDCGYDDCVDRWCRGSRQIKQTILTDAEQLTTKDLTT